MSRNRDGLAIELTPGTTIAVIGWRKILVLGTARLGEGSRN